MIEILLLPDRKKISIEQEELKLSQILESLDISELESVAILINNRLVSDKNTIVKKGDRVVLIKQATGG